MFDFSYESVRNISVVPGKEIRAQSVGGDNGDMKSTTKFSIVDGKTRVTYTAEWTPTSNVARSFGASTMKKQIAKQFDAMQKEIIKRSKDL